MNDIIVGINDFSSWLFLP